MYRLRKAPIPYKEIDSNVVSVVRAINRFPGIQTCGSCGGHKRPKPGQYHHGEWNVSFEIEPTEEGWFSLEFLSWLLNNDLRKAKIKVHLYPSAMPPYLNFPGRMLLFYIDARGWKPGDAAVTLERARKDLFVKPSQMVKFINYSWGKKELKEYRRDKKRYF